jgi:hypothetical protein
MKKQSFTVFLLLMFMGILSSCSVVGGIFKAGVGVGVFMIIFVIAIIIYFISKMGDSK